MPRKDRIFAALNVAHHRNHKFMALSDSAYRSWSKLLTWAVESTNTDPAGKWVDGLIPAAVFNDLAPTKARKELLAQVLIEPSGDDFQIHDYADEQMTGAQILDVRTKRRAAGSKGGSTKKANALANAKEELEQAASSEEAGLEVEPTSRTTQEELRTETLGDPWSSQPLEEPSQARCTEHRKVANPPPCSGCKAAREHAQRLVDRRESELQHEKAMRQTDAVRAELAEAKATATKPPTDLLAELKASLPTVRTSSVAESLDDQALAVARAKETA